MYVVSANGLCVQIVVSMTDQRDSFYAPVLINTPNDIDRSCDVSLVLRIRSYLISTPNEWCSRDVTEQFTCTVYRL